MSGDTYIPRTDSLPYRVCQFFRRLPDEEMSCKDIAIKWHADPKYVPVQLKSAVEAGLLERDGMVYSVGPNIEQINALDGAAAATFPGLSTPDNAGSKASGKGRQAPPIDIEAIVFERVELPPSKTLAQRWEEKLATMQEGESFAVDMAHAHALRAGATALRKQGRNYRVLLNQTGSDANAAPTVRVFCLGGSGGDAA